MRNQLHTVKRKKKKKAVTEDWSFVVISRSKLDPYQTDLLYVHAINIAYTMVWVGYGEIWNTSCVSCVAASESWRADYGRTYTTRVSYFAVTHEIINGKEEDKSGVRVLTYGKGSKTV